MRIPPVMTYGAEKLGTYTKYIRRKLRSAQSATERRNIGVTLRYKERASGIGSQTRVEDIPVQIKRRGVGQVV